MNRIHPEIVQTPIDNPYMDDLNPETHVEIVDESGFAGYDPTGKDILEAYETKYGHRPLSKAELEAFGDLVLRTAKYHEELIKEGEKELMLFGLETEELIEVGGALSLDTKHSHEVFPVIFRQRRTIQSS